MTALDLIEQECSHILVQRALLLGLLTEEERRAVHEWLCMRWGIQVDPDDPHGK